MLCAAGRILTKWIDVPILVNKSYTYTLIQIPCTYGHAQSRKLMHILSTYLSQKQWFIWCIYVCRSYLSLILSCPEELWINLEPVAASYLTLRVGGCRKSSCKRKDVKVSLWEAREEASSQDYNGWCNTMFGGIIELMSWHTVSDAAKVRMKVLFKM